MAKLYSILFATLMLQACIAAPNTEDHLKAAVEESPQDDQVDLKFNSEQYQVPEASMPSEDQNLQGQRQKRFYDYFDFDFPPFVPYNYNYIKRDDSLNTGVAGTQDFLIQILKRVQTILSYTRQQAFSPPSAQYPISSFIPFYYIPNGNCDCNTAEAPDTGVEATTQGNDARTTQRTITSPPLPPADTTTQGVPPEQEPGPAPTDDTNVTIPDFTIRMDDMDDDEGDGTRPISFVPVNTKTSFTKPPPPVDHGTVQASMANGVKRFASTLRPPTVTSLPAQPQLPTNSIPTLCDGAVLTCCHQAEVTYDCFKSQGCPNPTSPDNPCDQNIILRVIGKFQNYYAKRRG